MNIISLWKNNKNNTQYFEQMLRPHVPNLYRLAYRFTNHPEDAEDLVQDVLIKLLHRVDELEKVEHLGSWLSRILYHHFIDSYRAKQRSPLHLVDGSENNVETIMHADDSSGEFVNAYILQESLQKALARLNQDQRLLIMLHDVEGFTMKEIHEMMDIAVGTIKSRLNRARKKLRETIQAMEPSAELKRVLS